MVVLSVCSRGNALCYTTHIVPPLQIAKESRGVVRELRKDAHFLGVQKEKETAQLDAERMASQKAFFNYL